MGNRLYESTVIPNRGAWIELETDASEVVAVRIDRNRKITSYCACSCIRLGY